MVDEGQGSGGGEEVAWTERLPFSWIRGGVVGGPTAITEMDLVCRVDWLAIKVALPDGGWCSGSLF